jgi:hypothetical protein
MYRVNRGGIRSYLSICAQEEHFIRYRQLVRDSIARQLGPIRTHAAVAAVLSTTAQTGDEHCSWSR